MSRPFRALIVTPSYPAPDDPLAGIFIHRQIVNLARCGFECRVLTLRPAPPRFPTWLLRRTWVRYRWCRLNWPRILDGVPAETVFYSRQWTKGEDVIPAMGTALAEWIGGHPDWPHPDLVYAQFLWTGGAAALALRDRFGWPVAAMARGGEMEQWHATNSHCRRYVEHVLRAVDQPLANCRALRDKADRLVLGSAARIEVVYNGCDAALFQPPRDKAAVRRALGIPDGERVAVVCGSVESVKGIDELAAAWARFATTHRQWRLVVIGRVVEQALARRLKASAGGVRLLGQVSESRVIAWLQAADLYLQPSRLEGLANATMEAMAVGLPVIATDVGGQGELIRDGENGWLVAAADVDALASVLQAVTADPDRARRCGVEARRTIETMFDGRGEAGRLAMILRRTAKRD